MADLPEFPPRYEMLRELGVGGMSHVYLAVDLETRAEVALKMARANSNELDRRRFEREAEALARIQHPNVVRVLDYGLHGRRSFLVLELLDGVPLTRLPAGVDPIAPMLDIAAGLDEVHRSGLVHRDMKPANAFLTTAGRGVLLDLGLVHDPDDSRITGADMVPGTLSYLSPERLRGEPPTPAGDWYAWGITLYVLLERYVPFTTRQLADGAGGKDLPPLLFRKTPEGHPVRDLLRALVAADPAARPAGRNALAAALDSSPPLQVPDVPISTEAVPAAATALHGVVPRREIDRDPHDPSQHDTNPRRLLRLGASSSGDAAAGSPAAAPPAPGLPRLEDSTADNVLGALLGSVHSDPKLPVPQAPQPGSAATVVATDLQHALVVPEGGVHAWVWDLAHQTHRTLELAAPATGVAALSPQGTVAAVACDQGRLLQVLEVGGPGRGHMRIPAEHGAIRALSFSTDARRLGVLLEGGGAPLAVDVPRFLKPEAQG